MILDPFTSTLEFGNRVIQLRPTGARILAALARNQEIVSSATLLRQAWPDGSPADGDSAVKVQMVFLRRALRAAGIPAPIQTVFGEGYYLRAPIEIRQSRKDAVIPSRLVPLLREILSTHRDAPAAHKLLAFVS